MPEIVSDKKVFSLLEVAKSIHRTLYDRYKSAFWVSAEMNKLNLYKHSGHCYPELVQKENGKVIAQLKATLWRADFNRVNKRFQEVLKEPLKDGIKILFLAEIEFDSLHGVSLQIRDIDPNYTLGDLEREKKETINKLLEEGIFGRNKTLKLPLLPQRLAIISVETSKGYADFIKVIETNEWGFKFFHLLFPTILQGEKAVGGIIGQLNQIRKVRSHFDVVAIMRGGGGDIGLSCYNDFDLAKAIAMFPLPVITGIGHATNETVVEMISFANAITPTKLAEYLLQKFHNYSTPVLNAEQKIIDKTRRFLSNEDSRLQSALKVFVSVTAQGVASHKHQIASLQQSLQHQSRFLLKDKNAEISNLEKNLENMSPAAVLKRGYSLTLQDGKAVKSVTEVKAGSSIETLVADGSVISTVQTTNKSTYHG